MFVSIAREGVWLQEERSEERWGGRRRIPFLVVDFKDLAAAEPGHCGGIS